MGSKTETKKRILLLTFSTINLGIQVALFAICYLKYYSTWMRLAISSGFWFKGHVLFISIYFVLLLAFCKMYGALRVGYQRNVDSIISQIIGTLITNTIVYFILSLFCMELMNVVYYIPMTIVQLTWASLWIVFTNYIYKKAFPARALLLVHGNRPIEDILSKFESRKDKYCIQKMMNISEGVESICKESLNGYGGIVIWDIPSQHRNDILKFCYTNSIRVYIMPKISDVILSGAEALHLFDSPIMLTREYALTVEQLFFKRLADIILSLILIVLTSPFMLITAILVKCYDGGPVLYKQVRCTKDMKPFKIAKFRSMKVDAEKDGVARLASANDSRITPVGKFIRKVRLDELPQLFNILAGDMSFIGPRPERPEIIEQYKEVMPEFVFRNKVKAGLAGYAQVYGKYNTSPYDKLKLDIYYIENYSIWLDIKLILLTIKILFTPDATEGVSDNQITALKESMKDKE
ncbi:MAG: exopolysaccharide biosynthesis polyprenyl glycosylphosphotransferase [Lachnospiraceae bacterium]|nr:exopolysaccharide biosynthesis polyprenyl glycosylphosphotransferase [Lachnospiraceae bacterium]